MSARQLVPPAKFTIEQSVERILTTRRIASSDYLSLVQAMLSQQVPTEHTTDQIRKIFDYLQMGIVRVSDQTPSWN